MDGKTKESNLGTPVRRKLKKEKKKTLPIVTCQRRVESHGEAIKTIKDHHGRICCKHAREKTHVPTLLNTLTGREAHRASYRPPAPTPCFPHWEPSPNVIVANLQTLGHIHPRRSYRVLPQEQYRRRWCCSLGPGQEVILRQACLSVLGGCGGGDGDGWKGGGPPNGACNEKLGAATKGPILPPRNGRVRSRALRYLS